MLPPAPTCRRALQRQIYTPSDSIWISDEALSSVFQRFCAVSKTRKRYGSFVPGPLENRRRLGKRRMTLQSNAAPTTSSGFAVLWGSFFGEVDRMKWQWQAPRSRDMVAEEASSGLLGRLLAWGASLKAPTALPELLVAEEHPPQALQSTAQSTIRFKGRVVAIPFMDEIRLFRGAIKTCSPKERPALCDGFFQKLEQTLSLSIHAEPIFIHTIQHIFPDLKQAFADSTEASQRCLALCQAMWAGISNSKVLHPSDFMDRTLRNFARSLCEIQMSEALQSLLSNILRSVSKTQLQVMHSSIARLANSWVLSWQEMESLDLDETSLALADVSVFEAMRAVSSFKTMIASLEKDPCAENNLTACREALQVARAAIISSAKTVREAELKVRPNQRSIRALSAALSSLPTGVVRTIIDQISSRIAVNAERTNVEIENTIQWKWLSFVLQLPHVNERIVLDAWHKYGAHLDYAAASKILLDHWISRGLTKRPDLTRIIFDISLDHCPNTSCKSFAYLLRVMDWEREKSSRKMMLLFKFLDELGQHETIYRTCVALNDRGFKIQAGIMDAILDKMAIANPQLALKTFRTYKFLLYVDAPLRLERCPNLIFAMIGHHPDNTPTIWRLLGIPDYENLPRRDLANFSKNPAQRAALSPAAVKHFTTMATLFAHCKQISQRVAFRNVMQCLFHLRRYNAPITPEFTRALVHAGIAREIEHDGWIAKERHKWILSLVEKVEGTKVATTVDEVVAAWNELISLRVSKRDRGSGIEPKW